MRVPGAPMSESGAPSEHEEHLQRTAIDSQQGTTGAGASRTPLELLDGVITPSGCGNFDRVLERASNADDSAAGLCFDAEEIKGFVL